MTKRVRNDRQMTQQSWDCVELTRKKWCFWRNKQEKNSTQKTRNKQLIIPWKVWQSTTKKPGDSSIFSINQSINQFIHLHDWHILAIFTCHTCHRRILEDTRHTQSRPCGLLEHTSDWNWNTQTKWSQPQLTALGNQLKTFYATQTIECCWLLIHLLVSFCHIDNVTSSQVKYIFNCKTDKCHHK